MCYVTVACCLVLFNEDCLTDLVILLLRSSVLRSSARLGAPAEQELHNVVSGRLATPGDPVAFSSAGYAALDPCGDAHVLEVCFVAKGVSPGVSRSP